ncbi:hypothetical protein K501DRAFT_163610, partial [Backusella circina FSU 941]
KGKTPLAVVPATRAKSATILGTIAIHGVVKITVGKPNPPSSKKRRLAEDREKKMGTGTNTNHYVAFLLSLMNELDKFKSMKGVYLVMDNAPIH